MQPEPVGSIENRIIYIKQIVLVISFIQVPPQLKAIDPLIPLHRIVGLVMPSTTPSAHVDASSNA
jgi:hypothetical protein